ncbi:MAG: C-GCAxxG-C-C family protein [Clostridiales bacterium]|nr:C-GCAxxG-C-C family protein [Clostridiales bacterium]
MKERSIYYYRNGYNCSQCVLKAVESKYGKPISKMTLTMLNGVNVGFGIGGVCSVLIAGVMAFGMFFDSDTVKRLRLRLFDEFTSLYPNINCSALIKIRGAEGKCEKLIGDIAGIIERLIESEIRN